MNAHQRRSSSLKPSEKRSQLHEYFNQQYPQNNKLAERNSKIPLRNSSQSSIPNKVIPVLKRSNTLGPSVQSTPLSSDAGPSSATPLEVLYTPKFFTASNQRNRPLTKERNLQDKEFQKEAFSLVSSYFQINPTLSVSSSDIRHMTIKVFIEIINHLFAHIGMYEGALVQFTNSDYKEGLPKYMKKLSYPNSLTKGWLQTVNVPQYWPNVLGLISWLVAIVYASSMYDPEKQLNSIARENPGDSFNVTYFRGCIRAIKGNNLGNQDAYDEVCLEVIREIENEQGSSDEHIALLEDENTELEQLLVDPTEQAERDVLDELEQRLAVAEADAKRNEGAIVKEEDDIEKTDLSIEKKERNKQTLSSGTERTKEEIEMLNKKITTQAMSIAEFSEMKKKCDFLQTEINYMEKECEDHEKLIEKCDHDFRVKRDKILRNAHAFNRSIIQLEQQVPELTGLRARVDPESSDVVNDVEKILTLIRTHKNELATKCEERMRIREDQSKKVDTMRRRIRDISVDNENNRTRKETMSEELVKLRKKVAEVETLKKEEVQKLEAQVLDNKEKQKEYDNVKEQLNETQKRFAMLNRGEEIIIAKQQEKWALINDKVCSVKERMQRLGKNTAEQEKERQRNLNELLSGLGM